MTLAELEAMSVSDLRVRLRQAIITAVEAPPGTNVVPWLNIITILNAELTLRMSFALERIAPL